ncbi:MAG: RNA-binding S4 domain-containing protein [Colwellia sp.]
MSSSYIEVELNSQPVELCKLLKIANLVSGGGEAKIVISEGYVLLNGEVEFQKRKKIYHDDVIEFNGETIQLIVNEKLSGTQEMSVETAAKIRSEQSSNKVKMKPKKDSSPVIAEADDRQVIVPKKRRPISF